MNVLDKLNDQGLVFDGAMGSMLIRSGLAGGKASEIWNLENPAAVQAIHRAYYKAGSDVVTSNTFGGSPLKLKKVGIEQQCAEINTTAVGLVKEIAGPGQWVAADIGPIGEMLQPSGTLSFEAARDCFAQQAEYLAQGCPDLFIVETMFDLNESLAAIQGIRTVSELPVFATLTFQQMPKGFATLMGNPVKESMQALLAAGAVVVGANCSLGSDTMVALADDIRHSIDSPVMIQPNAGMPAAKGSDIFYPEDEEFFATNMAAIKALGVEVIGGCCGSTPEYIRRVVEKIKPDKR